VNEAPRYVEFIDGLPRNPGGKVLQERVEVKRSGAKEGGRNNRIAGNETSQPLAISHKHKPDD
jgi:hypothetical protein